MSRSRRPLRALAATLSVGLVSMGLVVTAATPALAYSVDSWPVGESPIGVSLSADSTEVYVAERGDPGATPPIPSALSAWDATTGEFRWRLDLAGEPTAVLASPVDNVHVFVASYNAGAVWEVDTSATPPAVTRTVTGQGGPVALAASLNGDRLFVGTLFNPQWQVDLATFTSTDFNTAAGVRGLAVTRDDGSLVATLPGSGAVQRVDVSGAIPVPAVPTTPVGAEPWGIATDPTRAAVYVANSAPPSSMTTLVPGSVESTITIGDGARQVAIYPDGSRVYVAGLSSGLNVVNHATQTNDSITVGSATEGVATSPDGTRVYLASGGDDSIKVFTRPTAAPAGDHRVDEGTPVTFAPAIGYLPDGFQWQRSADGASWTDIAGATSETYTFSPTLGDSGAQFRVVLTSRIFPDTISPAGTLTVDEVLAPTGVDQGAMLWLGIGAVVLLLGGMLAVVMTRRRRE